MCERKWIEVVDQAVIDIEAFVLFRKAKRFAPQDDPKRGDPEPIWLIEAFPGPQGGFVPIGAFMSELEANCLLAVLSQKLIPE